MTPDDYRQFLRSHGLTQLEFARLLGNSARSGQYWASESVPPYVATVVELIKRRPETLDRLREIARERDAVDS